MAKVWKAGLQNSLSWSRVSASPHHRVAALIAARIITFAPTQRRKFVLILPPVPEVVKVYDELARMCRQGMVSFEHVVVFTTHEYVGVGPADSQSRMLFMERNFFSQVDLPPAQALIPLGNHPDNHLEAATYEARLQSYGGAHLALLSLSHNALSTEESIPNSLGLIGLEEFRGGVKMEDKKERERCVAMCGTGMELGVLGVGSGVKSCAVVDIKYPLDWDENAWDKDDPPTRAISLGLFNYSQAAQVLIYAPPTSAPAVKKALQGPVSHLSPASWFQFHADATLITDSSGAADLDPETIKALSVPKTTTTMIPLSFLDQLNDPTLSLLANRTVSTLSNVVKHNNDENNDDNDDKEGINKGSENDLELAQNCIGVFQPLPSLARWSTPTTGHFSSESSLLPPPAVIPTSSPAGPPKVRPTLQI